MKLRNFIRLMVIFVFLFNSGITKAQNFKLGLTLGSSFIHWTYFADDNFNKPLYNHCSYADTYIPKTIGGTLAIIFPAFAVRVALDYGQTQSNMESDTPGAVLEVPVQGGSNNNLQIESLTYAINTKAAGFSASTAFLFPFSMGRKRILSIYPGLGVGYYNYQFSGDWQITDEEIDHNNISTIYTANGDYDKARVAGVVQYFIFGIDIKTVSKLHVFIEFSKMGLSMLRQISELNHTVYQADNTGTAYTKTYQKKIGEIKSDYNANAGLSDIGITFGINISL